MEDSVIQSGGDPQKRFLQEGIRTYLDASTAIIFFEREIQKICKRVLKKHLSDYNAAVGISLTSKDIQCRVWPTKDDEFDDWRTIAAAIEGKSIAPSVSWWGFYCQVIWQRTEKLPYAWVGEWFKPQSAAKQIFQKFQALGGNLELDGKEVAVWRFIETEGEAEIEQTLDSLMRQWIDLWKQAGGTKGVFDV